MAWVPDSDTGRESQTCIQDSDSSSPMLSMSQFVKWTGITVFELWLHVLGLFIFTILLTLKHYNYIGASYWVLFSPLFAASAFDAYFLFIVFVRTVLAYRENKVAPIRWTLKTIGRNSFSWIRLMMIAIFEVFLCHKIDGELNPKQVSVKSAYGIVFMPVWVLMAGLLFQACRLF